MRNFGVLLIVAGLVGGFLALNMDTSIETGFGRVNNLGLMSDRQNYLIAAGVVLVAGVLLAVFANAGGLSSAPLASPFDEADRQKQLQRERHAASLGITRVDGVFHFGNQSWHSMEDAIAGAESAQTDVEVNPVQYEKTPMTGKDWFFVGSLIAICVVLVGMVAFAIAMQS